MIEEVQVQPTPATPASTEVDIKVTMDGGGEKGTAAEGQQGGNSIEMFWPTIIKSSKIGILDMSRGIRNPGDRQCLGFGAADS